MSRNSLWYAVVALLGGSAVALAAATFPTASRPEGTPGPGDDDGGQGMSSLPLPEDSPGSALEAPPLLAELLGLLALVAILAALGYLVIHWRDALWRFLEGAVLAGGLFLLYQLLSRFFSSDFESGELGLGDDPTFGGGDGAGGDQLVSTDPSSLAVILVLLVGLLLVGLAVVFGREPGDEDAGQMDGDADPETTAAVGRAAGRAADRIETAAETDNEIYRTWAEMARAVDAPDPETKTTDEFATAAIDAGMDPDDVRGLTRLFERARYGTDTPSEADEQRAVDLFRRIETTYAEEES